jgi:hypothetical protein
MKIARDNLLGGLVIIAIGLILLSQASSKNFLTTAEGIDPMAYPRVLIWILLFFGALIIISPSGKSSQSDLPFFSLRTAAVAATLVAYAALVGFIGFGVTSFVCACAIGWTMGWRRPKTLLLANFIGVASIWCMFTYVLNIPLPKGILF